MSSTTRLNPPLPTLEEVTGLGDTTVPDSDGIIEFGRNDFASSTNKRTLRSYISSLTNGQVPATAGEGEQGIVEYNGPIPDHGNAYPIDAGSGVNQNTFAGVDGTGVNVMQDYSDSGHFDGVNDKMLSDIINKGDLGSAHGVDPLSGHMLLQGIVGSTQIDGAPTARTEGAQVLIDAIPRTLDVNVFNPYPATGGTRTGDTIASATRPTGLAKVSRGTEILSRSPGNNPDRVGVDKLKDVALEVMLKATGKKPGDAGGTPSQVQEGMKRVESDSLRARTVSGVEGLNSNVSPTVTGEGFSTDDGVGETRYVDKSFGVTYNPNESFTGITSTVSSYLIIGASALAAVAVVGGVLSLATKPANRPVFSKLDASRSSELTKGSFKFEPPPAGPLASLVQGAADALGVSTDVTQLLNIYVPTNPVADYGQCMIIGFASLVATSYTDDDIISEPFFGSPDNAAINKLGILKIAGLSALRVAAVAVTGDKGYYMNLFREIIKDSGQLLRSISDNPTSLLSPTDGIGAIANSKIIRFVNVLAEIGDMIALQAYAKKYYKFNTAIDDPYKESGFLADPKESGTVDGMKKFATQRIRGARFGGTRGSHLGVSELPSAHLIPSTAVKLWGGSTGNDQKLKSFSEKASSGEGRTNLRISQEQIASLEDVLDAEYMPFYFQDLRTNEIIAFHAFLEDLSDSYTANYNGTGGYGRVEDIKTYKDTKRSVGLTFHVIATNEQDFDYMWWQVNKLTTMVYPQWSRGRELTGKVNDNDFKFIQPFSQIPNATPIIRVRVGDLIRSNYSRFNLKRLFGYRDKSTGQETETSYRYYAKPGRYINNDDEAGPSVQIDEPIDLGPTEPKSNGGGIGLLTGDVDSLDYFTKYDTGSLKTIRIYGNQITRVTIHAKPTPEANTFYDAEGNSVIRSFETSMGKGLAAVVTQLGFTWMDGLWGAGEDGPGNRAPRSCKVQMSFDPIHDIAPGLDHEGLNRAPIYPVGGLVNRLVEGDEGQEGGNPYGVGSKSVLVPTKKPG